LSVILVGCGINNELHYTNNDVSHSFPDSLHNTDIPADDINSLSKVYEIVEIETKKHALNESLNVITNSIDIQYLFGQGSFLFDEINYLFGNHIGYVEISPSPEYIFDTGVIVTPSYLVWVQSIRVDYRQPNYQQNHFFQLQQLSQNELNKQVFLLLHLVDLRLQYQNLHA